MERNRVAALTSRTAILIVIVAMLTACDAADGLIGIHAPFLPGYIHIPAPTISADEGTSIVFVNNSVNLTASGSGDGVPYNWPVTGSGSIVSTGSTVAYTAPSTEETATVSVYAGAAGSGAHQGTRHPAR